jgi:transcriptional regulator with XRE-family HTH domain
MIATVFLSFLTLFLFFYLFLLFLGHKQSIIICKKGAVEMLDLKAQRESLKLTLEDVGNYVGVGKSTVRKWENGMINNMGRDKIKKYATILQISPLALIGEVETSIPDWADKQDEIDIEKALKLNTTTISYDGIQLTEDEKEKVDAIIRSVLWDKLKDKKEG